MEQGVNVEDFRRKLMLAFPPQPFCGLVSDHDECDEGIALLRELPRKRWDEIPTEFIDFNSGSLPLMLPDAVVAFLPAWLMRSVETFGGVDLGGEGVLSQFTMYFLCPGDEEDGWDDECIRWRVGLFNSAQRSVIADFLRSIADCDELSGWHAWAEYGLRWWNT